MEHHDNPEIDDHLLLIKARNAAMDALIARQEREQDEEAKQINAIEDQIKSKRCKPALNLANTSTRRAATGACGQ
jgi:hypothetical protein